MTDRDPQWVRLGNLLLSRRRDLGRRNRRRFCEETGLDYRVITDLENAARTNFSAGTLRAVESAYWLRPGSLERTLAGGELEPLANVETASERSLTVHPVAGESGRPQIVTNGTGKRYMLIELDIDEPLQVLVGEVLDAVEALPEEERQRALRVAMGVARSALRDMGADVPQP